MDEEQLDAEVIAALLDDRLSADARSAVLASIAADPVWRELLSDAGAIAEELREGTSATHSGIGAIATAPASRRSFQLQVRHRNVVISSLAAAAVLAVIAVSRRGREATVTPQSDLPTVIALGREFHVTDSMREGRWSVMRSGGLSVSPQARSVRLGVLSVDAVSAMRNGAQPLAADKSRMLEVLEAFDGSAPAADLLRLASDSAGLQVALAAIRSLSDAAGFEAGVWLELELLRSSSVREGGASIGVTRVPASLLLIARSDSVLAADVQTLGAPSKTTAGRTALLRAVLRRIAE